jgi:hypothetical protein
MTVRPGLHYFISQLTCSLTVNYQHAFRKLTDAVPKAC